MVTVAEAEQQVLEAAALLAAEDCPLEQAHGRVLRQPLAADRDLPPFDRVALDGYAIRHAAWRAGVRRFRVAGLQAAGTVPLALAEDGDCVEVMTGAVLPTGADTIVPYEDTVRDGERMELSAGVEPKPGQAIHRRGSDRAAGAGIVPPGKRLGGVEIAVAAACGYAHLAVTMQPRIAVLATGDELVDVGSPVAPHQIRRSNDHALRAALAAAGYPLVECHHLRDVRQKIEELLRRILAGVDVVVATGGVSKGRFDFLPGVLDDLGVRKRFQGVAQRPGKPFWFGLGPRRTPVFALPGNPASSFVCLHRYVLPALAKMSGCAPSPAEEVVLAEDVVTSRELTGFVPARLAAGPGGARHAAPALLNTSGDFAGLAGTDGFLELAAGPGRHAAGAVVPFRPWA